MDGLESLRTMRSMPRFAAVPFIRATSVAQVKFAAIPRDGGPTHLLA